MPSQVLNMWKGGKLICQKRATALNFYQSITTDLQNGTNMTVCAVNQSYQVNTLPNVSCPITQASNNSLTASQTSLLLDPINLLYFNYVSQNGYPIVDFIVD